VDWRAVSVPDGTEALGDHQWDWQYAERGAVEIKGRATVECRDKTDEA